MLNTVGLENAVVMYQHIFLTFCPVHMHVILLRFLTKCLLP